MLYLRKWSKQNHSSTKPKLMLDALDHDLSQEHNLNNAIATFEELRNRARNAMELRRAYKLMETVRETK